MNIFRVLILLALLLTSCRTTSVTASGPPGPRELLLQEIRKQYQIIDRTIIDFQIVNGVETAAVKLRESCSEYQAKYAGDQGADKIARGVAGLSDFAATVLDLLPGGDLGVLTETALKGRKNADFFE